LSSERGEKLSSESSKTRMGKVRREWRRGRITSLPVFGRRYIYIQVSLFKLLLIENPIDLFISPLTVHFHVV
jgi:hypothetical protein